jgi:hypothetical protein
MTTNQDNDGSQLDFSVSESNRLEDAVSRSRRKGGLIGQFRKPTIMIISEPPIKPHRITLSQFRAASVGASQAARKNAKPGGTTAF